MKTMPALLFTAMAAQAAKLSSTTARLRVRMRDWLAALLVGLHCPIRSSVP